MTEPAGKPGFAVVLRMARKIVVATAGMVVLGIGVAMIVLPGPALLVIPLGLALLATEFAWAGRLLGRLRDGTAGALRRVRQANAKA